MHENDPAICWEANAETWTRQSRAGHDIYRDCLNTPAFLTMLPPVAGLEGLDAGCGEGTNTRRVAALGARMKAVDISPTFIRHARTAEKADPFGVEFYVADVQKLPFADTSFDFITAFMCMMDVSKPEKAFREMRRVLRPGGFFQFSILHPCFAPPHRRVLRDENGEARAIEVADYFDIGAHVEEWRFGTLSEEERERTTPFRVPYVHMTLSEWVNALRRSGFLIDCFGEPCATQKLALEVPYVADTRIAPLFLHVRAVK